ncbi:hypothetical protein [Vibrio phage BONAISHI]|nr:hypothetical protein [Vibrio phage BONAISHI]
MIKDIDVSRPEYLSVCRTERQRVVLKAYISHGQNATKASKELGVSRVTVMNCIEKIVGYYKKANGTLVTKESVNGRKIDWDQFCEAIRLRNVEELSHEKIANRLGVSKSAIISLFARKTHKEFWEKFDKDPIGGSPRQPSDHEVPWNGKRTIFITSAQNNTHIHKGFLNAIKTFCKRNDADFITTTFTYAKMAGQPSQKGQGQYDRDIKPYINDDVIRFSKEMVMRGNLNISPSAVNPLTGMEGFCRGHSAIFGHVKQELQSIAQPKGEEPVMMYTTGTISLPNYRQQKAGQKAEFDHIIGGLVLEIDEVGMVHVRQVNAESDTGNFFDYDTYYTADGAFENQTIAGLVPGDIHTNQIHPDIARATLGIDVAYLGNGRMSFSPSEAKSLMLDLKPCFVMGHDICDFKPRNHHNINNPHFRYRQFIHGEESIRDEIDNVGNLLHAVEQHQFVTPVVVNSNHDRATMRYMLEQVKDWHRDPINARFFLETQAEIYKGIEENREVDPLEWNIRLSRPELRSIFLKQDESFPVVDVECGYHGDTGLDGARGGLLAFKKLGIKMCIGHSHKAGIKSGVYQSGITCKKDPDYAKGPSSWSWSHTLIYNNGKRTIVTMKIDEFGNVRWRR